MKWKIMLWKNECGRVKQLLSLDAGQDLSEQDRTTARRHVARCADCRSHLERVRAGQQVLEQVRAASTVGDGTAFRSVWPELKAQLLLRQAPSRRQTAAALLLYARQLFHTRLLSAETINGWLPVGALAVACLAILVVADTAPHGDRPDFGDQSQFSDGTFHQSPHLLQPAKNLIQWPGETESGEGAPVKDRADAPRKSIRPSGGEGLNFQPEPSRIDPVAPGERLGASPR